LDEKHQDVAKKVKGSLEKEYQCWYGRDPEFTVEGQVDRVGKKTETVS
jgi:hypothetical protein